MGSELARLRDGLRRRLRYSGVHAEPGIVLRELYVAGHRLLIGDVEGSIASEVVAGEIGVGAYDFSDIEVHPGDTLIDVGAHVGLVSIYLAKCYPKARILAFEPMPRVFTLLEQNLHRNRVKNVQPFNLALSGDGRDITLVAHLGSNTGGGSAQYSTVDIPGHENARVPSVTLDAALETHHVASTPLLKIDIEGSEYEVLYPSKLLSRVQNIRGEFHENSYLRAHGYSIDALQDHCERIIGEGRVRCVRCEMSDY